MTTLYFHLPLSVYTELAYRIAECSSCRFASCSNPSLFSHTPTLNIALTLFPAALTRDHSSPPRPQTATLDELSGLKSALALEREERIAEDDEIVQV